MPLPGLTEMRAAAKADECPLCGDPKPKEAKGRTRGTCGDPVCITAWMRCYQRDRRRNPALIEQRRQERAQWWADVLRGTPVYTQETRVHLARETEP